jgi:hypothetical protein
MKASMRGFVSAALLGAAPLAQAHTGHPLPAGVPLFGHLHLWDTLVVAPLWLAVAGMVVAAAAALGVRHWRRAAAQGATRDGRGGDPASR